MGSLTGVGMYLKNVLAAWPADCPLQPRLFATGPRPFATGEAPAYRPLNLTPLSRLPVAGPAGRRLPWFARRMLHRVWDWRFGRTFRRSRCAAYFEPNHLAIRLDGPTIATVHDLSVLDHPQWHPADRVALWEESLASSVGHTAAWLADSRFTRMRMIQRLAIPPERITVVPLAARPLRFPPAQRMAAVGQQMGLPPRYILHLGTIEPRKNIGLLLDAISLLDAGRRRRCPLVLAGGAGWGGQEFWRQLSGHPLAGEVLCTGYIDDDSAAALLAGATALVAPSHYEGFGLPILEAFAAGTPVVCSDADAFTEIAAGAAAVLPTNDPSAWAAAIERIADDEPWADQLRQSGRARAADYSWSRCAAATAKVIRDTAGM